MKPSKMILDTDMHFGVCCVRNVATANADKSSAVIDEFCLNIQILCLLYKHAHLCRHRYCDFGRYPTYGVYRS